MDRDYERVLTLKDREWTERSPDLNGGERDTNRRIGFAIANDGGSIVVLESEDSNGNVVMRTGMFEDEFIELLDLFLNCRLHQIDIGRLNDVIEDDDIDSFRNNYTGDVLSELMREAA